MVKVFGDWIKDLGFYKFKSKPQWNTIGNCKNGVTESFFMNYFLRTIQGDELWELLWQAGQELNISGGTQNVILRLKWNT